jgi:glycosyltransferase involved in cell wall biosynthesis
MRILIATDSFPPVCGGSGWSTFELARGLRQRGHDVLIVQPRPGERGGRREFESLEVREVGAPTSPIPYVRNYLKSERLTARLTAVIREIVRAEAVDLVHAQHVLTAPGAVAAAGLEKVPVVCTVRDYWPVCYWSDLIHDYGADTLCPGCSPGMMAVCVRPRAGRAWPLALPFIPYMMGNLARKRAALARASAVVAVSTAIAADLKARAPALAGVRIETIPNPVAIEAIRSAAASGPAPLAPPYAIYAGKLAPNKGVDHLLPALQQAELTWPLVIVGDGPGRAALERHAATSGRDVRFLGWRSRDETLRWMGHASLLVFPSRGPESLSRVLLEAGALGVPIAAMDTGGTRDIVIDGVTGLLSTSPLGLGTAIARLASDRALAAKIGRAAREHVERAFDVGAVTTRIETLYRDLLAGRGDRPGEHHD